MTESEIQDLLYLNFSEKKNHELCVPNVKALVPRGESDLVSVTKSRFVHEFEIKISSSDFKREFKSKKKKHRLLENIHEGESKIGAPNYFWFAFSDSGVYGGDVSSVPSYAGVLHFGKTRNVFGTKYPKLTIERKAPRLHSDRASDRVVRYLERGTTIRYWNTRT